jgi:hypothetical protein
MIDSRCFDKCEELGLEIEVRFLGFFGLVKVEMIEKDVRGKWEGIVGV